MKKRYFILVAVLVVFFKMPASCSDRGDKINEGVPEAFRLRMNGRVDEARSLLQGIIAKDSTNAVAYYELARLAHYQLLGEGRQNTEEITLCIDKAVKIDPHNVIYAYYKAIASFLNAFVLMETGSDKVKPLVTQTCYDLEKVLELKPDYYEAMLYLVEIYGLLPPEMGGDSLKAFAIAGKLSQMDAYFGARAKATLLPENTDIVAYWRDILSSDAKNPRFLAETGKSCLMRNDPESAEKYFDEARKADPSMNILILDLARYHIMKVMQNKDLSKRELPKAKDLLKKYISCSPGPVIPLKAYAMGLLVRVEMFLGEQSEAEKLMEQTKALDPYFSRASGVPTLMLFDPPDQVTHHYFSFFYPF